LNIFLAMMNGRPEIAIVVVSYNTRDLLLECLASAVESAEGTSVELVVVDNGSRDGSFEAAREFYPHALAIRNSTNLGFGAACNQAINETSAPFILLLNSDARLTPSAFHALRDCIGLNDGCGAASCRLVNPQGEPMVNARNFLTPLNQAFELVGVGKGFQSRYFSRTHRLRFDASMTDCSIDWVDGACLILRRAAIDEVGFFDERFFMYSEDEDLCLRLKSRGWSVCITARGAAIHLGGASSKQNKFEMLRQFYASQLLFLSINRGPASVSIYKIAMKAALILKRLARRGAASREELNERLVAFRRASAGRE